MSKTIKYCPRCGFETENERDIFCPLCNDTDKPVKLEIKPGEASTHVPSSKPEDNLGSAKSSQSREGDSEPSKRAHQPIPEHVSEAQRLQIESSRKEEARKLQFLKDSFIVQYKKTLGDLDKVYQSVGITRATFSVWLIEDQSFADLFEDTKRKVEKEKAEWEAKEAEVKRKKKLFLQLYRSNDCNKRIACDETGIDMATFEDWYNSDPVFSGNVKDIEREFDAEQERIRRIRMRARIKIVLAIILLGVIGYMVYSKWQDDKADAKAKQEIQKQYDGLLGSFEDAVSKVHLDDMGADALERVASLLFELKSYEDVHKKDLEEPKYSVLRQRVLILCDDLFAYYRGKATPLVENPSLNEQDVKKYGGLKDRVKVLKSKI